MQHGLVLGMQPPPDPPHVALVGGRGRKSLRVDPGRDGHDTNARRKLCRFACDVVAHGDDELRASQDLAQRDAAPGSRAGTAISAPWTTTAYGKPSWPASRPNGRAGSRTTSSAPDAATSALMRRTSDGLGSSMRPARFTSNSCSASKAAASGCEVVGTVACPAGSLRHSSHR